MIKVKSYRPLVTENLIWDFPSRYKLKEVSEFLQEDIATVTDFISETAKETMSNQSVYWFIEDKKKHQIIALVDIKSIDFDNNSATLFTKFDEELSAQLGNEIAERLFMFVNEQISLSELEIEKNPTNVTKFFTSNGYSLINNTLKRE
jgi:bifunctional ADP-heptose synthase (sugar kinase/adenylyltransferase)